MTGTPRLLRPLAPLAVALAALTLSGCGGASEPEKNVKPGSNLSAESEAKLKELQATAKPIKRETDEEPAPKTKGSLKKGAKKAGPTAPKGLIPLRR